jgi:ubiquinone/menaquinone biosynthesis C-methylase UbiE
MIGTLSGKNANNGMPLTTADWHKRYLQQAGWSKPARDHIFQNLNLPPSASILEVGCGTGAVLADYSNNSSYSTFGLDIDRSVLHYCQKKDTKPSLTCGDAYSLPFPNGSFDLTYCHYLLLWLKHPLIAIKEMKRVTRSGSYLCGFAEPDYNGRIVFPTELEKITDLQTRSLIQQGINPNIGRQLRQLFTEANISKVKVGILSAEWNQSSDNLKSEQEIIKNDLAFLGEKQTLSGLDSNYQFTKDSIYFIPTFYACGQVD